MKHIISILFLFVSIVAFAQPRGQWKYFEKSAGPGYMARTANADSVGRWVPMQSVFDTLLSSYNVVYGSGVSDYVARWVTDSTLGTGILRDDGSNVGVGMAPNASYAMAINGSVFFPTDGQAIYGNSGGYFCPECSTNRMDFFNPVGGIRFAAASGSNIAFYADTYSSGTLRYEFSGKGVEANTGFGFGDRTLFDNYNFTPRTASGDWPGSGRTQTWGVRIDNIINSRGTTGNATWNVYNGADSSLAVSYDLSEGFTVLRGNLAVGSNNDTYSLEINTTDAAVLPVGTTAQRPAGAQGAIRFNTDSTWWEGYTGTEWLKFQDWIYNAEEIFYEDNFDLGANNVGAALDTIGRSLSTQCLVNNVMVSDGVTAQAAYKSIYNNDLCAVVTFNNPTGAVDYTYNFERTALINNKPGKTIIIEPGVLIQLDTFPDGAGDADTAYVDENAGVINANGVFSFKDVDDLIFRNYGRINASNKIGNTPLGVGTAQVRRSTHAIRLQDCDNADVRGGTVQDVWFGVFVDGSANNYIHDVFAIVGDTASSGPRRFQSGNDDQCCGDFNNAAVALGSGNTNSLLSNIKAFGYSEVIDLNPIVYNPTIFNVYGEDIYEAGIETSGAVGYRIYSLSTLNSRQGLELVPYQNQSSVGSVFGARIEYDTNAMYWLSDTSIIDEVIGIKVGFESSVYESSVILGEGVDYVNHAAKYRKTIDQSADKYGTIQGKNTLTIYSDNAYFKDSPVEIWGGDLTLWFYGSLDTNQTAVDIREGPAKVDVQQAVNTDTAATGTSLMTVATVSEYPIRYWYTENLSGFDDTLRTTCTAIAEPLHPVRLKSEVITEREDVLFAFFPEANYRWEVGDTVDAWEGVKGKLNLSEIAGQLLPVWGGDTSGIKFPKDAVLSNPNFDNQVDWNNHRVTIRFRIDTMYTNKKVIYRWGGNDPYRVKIDASGIYFEVSSTGWSNQQYLTPISTGVWYNISVIIDGADLTVRFGEDGAISEVITYTASQALATGNGDFIINSTAAGAESNAKTYSHIIVSSGAASATTAVTDETYIQCNDPALSYISSITGGWGITATTTGAAATITADTSQVDSKAARRYKDFNTYTGNPDTLSPFNGAVYGFDNVGFGWTQQIGLSNLDAGDSFTVFLVNSDTNAQTFDVSGTGTGGFIRPSANGDLNPDDTEAFTGASHYLEFIWDGSNFWIKE